LQVSKTTFLPGARTFAISSVDEAAAPLQVVADPDWLLDMLLNLVGNAVKFTGSGHVAVKCFARARDTPGLGSHPITTLACERAE